MLPRTLHASNGFTMMRSLSSVNRWAPLIARVPGQGHSFIRFMTTVTAAAPSTPNTPSSEDPGWNFVNSGSRREWQRADLHIVLVHPQIPQNAGNISRTCAATSVALHLVGPMGFELDNAKLKRAGLDYWDWVTCKVHPSWDEFYSFFNQLEGPKRLVGFSKLGNTHHATEGMYTPGTWLMFGAETTGLPPEAHAAAVESGGAIVKIPMSNYKHVRSLNLATSVGIGAFEALRQLDGAVLPEDVPGQEEGEASAEAANIEAVSTPISK